MNTGTRLMIVVDHPLYAEGIQAMLARHPVGVRCLAVRTAAAALQQLRAPGTLDIVIADYRLEGVAIGLELLAEIGAHSPTVSRVLMSGAGDMQLSQQAQRAGLAGYLAKNMEPAEWMQALEVILGGGRYFAARSPVASALNERQRTVLQLAAMGLANRMIAGRLHLTERTVKYHLRESFLRLSCSTRTEAVARAAAQGLITLAGD